LRRLRIALSADGAIDDDSASIGGDNAILARHMGNEQSAMRGQLSACVTTGQKSAKVLQLAGCDRSPQGVPSATPGLKSRGYEEQNPQDYCGMARPAPLDMLGVP
jgi:hypothetical protein